MGNSCAGPNLGRNGFLQSVSAAVWRTQPPDKTLPPPNAESDNNSSSTSAPKSENSANESVSNKGSQHKGSEPASQIQNTPPVHVKMAAGESSGKAEVKEEGNKSAKKHMKRVASVGLQIESVLQRKTGNLKDTYSFGKKLGQGQFGTTYLCVEKETGKEFACKSIAKRKLTTKEDVEDVRREIHIMHHLAGHPNVISIVAAYEDAVAVYVVMELCAGGELFDRIIQRGHYSERKAAELARIIVSVVEACHSLGVMHRDLKPENFLFINEEEESLLKTIDFGLSVFFRPGETFTDVVGSPYYVAPEVLRKLYGQECDVWSAGVIIYILLSGVPPFWDESEQGIFEQVLKGELDFVSEPWPSISDGAKDLVRRMLVRDPKKRLTVHEVLRHPWVQADGLAPDKPLDSAVLSRLKQFSAMNKLKKIAIRVIAERLSEEEIAGLKEMFKMIDTDNSGNITLVELKNGLERVGANLIESDINDLMQAADLDNSGTIDYSEFVAAMLNLNKAQKEDHLFAAFTYFDKDGSGYITADELQQACEQFGLGDVHLEGIMGEVDQDNDGRIDYGEFVAMMQDTEFGNKGFQNSTSIGTYMTGGQYERELNMIVDQIIGYINGIVLGNDGYDAWILDVDDTCISNLLYYKRKQFGCEPYDPQGFKMWASRGGCPAIPAALRLFNKLVQTGFKVILITGRDEETMAQPTTLNLHNQGFTAYERLILRSEANKGQSAVIYKSEMRKQLVGEGYRIWGNVGDQWSDLHGDCIGNRTFKFPNPMYFVP